VRLVIIGVGLAGMCGARSTGRLHNLNSVPPAHLNIALVAPQRILPGRPRLSEEKPETMTAPLLHDVKVVEVVRVQGLAEATDTRSCAVQLVAYGRTRTTLAYDWWSLSPAGGNIGPTPRPR